MVNALGGISLYFPDPVRDAYSGLNVSTTGCQSVSGTAALALVRSRHLYYFKDGTWNYDGMSDWSRIQRQQAFFHAVLNKANSEFPDLFAIKNFVQATAHDLQVDSGFKASEMMSLGLSFRHVASSNLATQVLPTTSGTVDGSDVLYAAQPYANEMIASFLAFGSASATAKTSAFISPSVNDPTQTAGVMTMSSETQTTTPSSSVIFDNPKDLPEPWNPKPC
jgi:anionic cell wall polymer biosynthesis LytR-Cps2A-Psr (LCP) family protein